MDSFDWDKKSEKYVNNQVLLFNKKLLHIMSNFSPIKKMVFDDRKPLWFDMQIKNFLKYKSQIYKDTPNRKSNHNFQFHFLLKISLTQKSIKLKRNIRRICHVSYLKKVSILKNIGSS